MRPRSDWKAAPTTLYHLRGYALGVRPLRAGLRNGWSGPASADDAPPPPLAPVLDRLFPELKEEVARFHLPA